MINNIHYLKDRTIIANNIKKVHNYSYYTDKVIGTGYFSTVYQAFSHTTHEQIAAKVVKMSTLTFKKLQQLLEQEIETLLSLNHMNTIKCFDVLKTFQQCYIFMEYCEGGSLDKIVKQRGPMSEQQAWPYIKGIYQGLKYLNSKKIIHRDLKPANILLKGDKVKIADFGFAIHAMNNFKDMNIGSPYYMTPQALFDNLYGSKTDVWSFGVIMYELLHGRTPFYEAIDGEALKSRIIIPLKPQDFKSQISQELVDLILSCLEIDQNKRISIKQIEQSHFMRNRYQALLYSNVWCESKSQPGSTKNEVHYYGNRKIIRIPSKLSIKNKVPQKLTNENIYPQNINCSDINKLKSYSQNSQSQKITSSSFQTNPESLQITNSYLIIERLSVFPSKLQVKTHHYRYYPRQLTKITVDNSINNVQ